MTMISLNNGAIVLLRDGYQYIKIDDKLIRLFNTTEHVKTIYSIYINQFKEDYKHMSNKKYDIMAFNNPRSVDLGLQDVLTRTFPVWDWVRTEDEPLEDCVQALKYTHFDKLTTRRLNKVLFKLKEYMNDEK